MDNIMKEVRMGAHFMGDEFALQQAEPLRVHLRGPRNIAQVDVIKDGKTAANPPRGLRRMSADVRAKIPWSRKRA